PLPSGDPGRGGLEQATFRPRLCQCLRRTDPPDRHPQHGYPRMTAMLRIALTALVLVTLAGCALKQNPPVTRIDLHLTGSDRLNPDLHGRPSPIVLRLYELKNPVTFEHAEFFSLYQQPQETLALDLIAHEELELRPGQSQELNLLTTAEGTYRGVLAAYRNLPDARWQQVLPLRVGQLNQLHLQLDELGISDNDHARTPWNCCITTSRVVWHEGILLRPQHFQQNDRYYDHQLKARTQLLHGCAHGFFNLEIDHQFLAMGKLVLSQASGILPDGSLFELGSGHSPLSL